MLGETISHYKVLEKIGEGGMGEVYLAQDTALDRKVALKFLPEELQQDSTAKKRFLREAKSAAALDHPYICHIHEVGEVEGKSFISMEYVQGETLKEKLAGGPLPLNDALEKATEVAEALEEAHEQGIVHRDLKPANIMLTLQGHVKVMDFGLAKQVTPVEGQKQEITTALTKQGSTLGTVPYMSPEQVRGQVVDIRSDIFSFGVVLYEMLSGVNPFKRDTSVDTSHAIVGETPAPLTRYTDDIPVLLQHTVRKMLAKEPDRRWQTAQDLTDELKWITEDASQANVPPAQFRGRRGMLLAAAAACLIVGLLSGITAWNLRPVLPLSTIRFAMSLPDTGRLSTLARRSALALSPTGTHLVYGSSEQLYLRAMDQQEARPIAGTEGGFSPFFSPDGQWVAFFTPKQLKKVPISGGQMLIVCDVQNGLTGAWGSSGTIVFGIFGGTGLWRVSAAGGTPEPLTELNTDTESDHDWPVILPGDKGVVFTVRPAAGSWDDARIVVKSLETGEERVLIEGGTHARYLPTGHLVYARAGVLRAVPFDLAKLEVRGDAVSVVQGIVQSFGSGVAHFSVSSNGSLVYVPATAQATEERLVWVQVDGSKIEPLVEEPLEYPRYPRLSPDGTRVAVDVRSGTTSDIWILDIARRTRIRVTTESDNFSPAWTPEGRHVAFTSLKSGFGDLYWKLADGTGDAEPLLKAQQPQYAGSWSPDGQLLAYTELNPATLFDIWVLPVEGEPSVFLATSFSEHSPSFSPDGHWLAYVSDESGQDEVYVQAYPGPGGRVAISIDGGQEPVWSEDGRKLFYRRGDAVMAVTLGSDPATAEGQPQQLFEGRYRSQFPGFPNYDVSADGRRFLMVERNEQLERPMQINVVLNWFEELKRLVPTP